MNTQYAFYNACEKDDLLAVQRLLKSGAKMDGSALGLSGKIPQTFKVFNWLLKNNCPINDDTWFFLIFDNLSKDSNNIDRAILQLQCEKIMAKCRNIDGALFWAKQEDHKLYQWLVSHCA